MASSWCDWMSKRSSAASATPPTISTTQMSARRIEEHLLDEVVEGEADDRRGQERDDDGGDEAARLRIARKRNQDVPEPGEIDDDHGEDRAELNEHAEGIPEGLLAMRADAEKLSREKQMGGRGNRDELRNPLNDPEKDGIEYGL